jgi:hypothetical protein
MALGSSPLTQFSIAGHNRNTLMEIVLNLLPFTFYLLPFTFFTFYLFYLFTSKGGVWKNMDQNSFDLSIVGFLAFVHGLARASSR